VRVVNPDTGRIEQVLDEKDARRRGLIPIPPDQEAKVRAMNRHQRRAWAAKQRHKPKQNGV
jgi:hypothetical protein